MKIKLLFLANIFTGGKLEFFPGINAFLNYHCVFGFQINYIYSLLDEKNKKIYPILHRIKNDIIDFFDCSGFFKLNDNEICIYDEKNSEIKIFELLD